MLVRIFPPFVLLDLSVIVGKYLQSSCWVLQGEPQPRWRLHSEQEGVAEPKSGPAGMGSKRAEKTGKVGRG